MDTAAFLVGRRGEIVDAAVAAIGRTHLRHYEGTPASEVRRRLDALFDHLVESMERKDLGPIVRYGETLAGERFTAGFDLSEVQAAMNVLEEATWSTIVSEIPPEGLAEALGLVGTVLGAGKDALARTYVSLATRTHTPSLDLRALFAGTDTG
jgi:hypothetical protein